MWLQKVEELSFDTGIIKLSSEEKHFRIEEKYDQAGEMEMHMFIAVIL